MPSELTFASSSFDPGESIPREFTCDGDDVSPSLEWAFVPNGAQSLVLVVEDPDAPGQTFTHWVLFDVPGDQTSLPRDVDVGTHFSGHAPVPREGTNDFGDIGYGGPCPPAEDGPHRYFFRLYALDNVLALEQGATKHQVMDAMNGHVLDETELIGTYER